MSICDFGGFRSQNLTSDLYVQIRFCTYKICAGVSSFRAEMMIQKPSEKERQKSGKIAVLGGKNEKGS